MFCVDDRCWPLEFTASGLFLNKLSSDIPLSITTIILEIFENGHLWNVETSLRKEGMSFTEKCRNPVVH